MVRAIGVAGLAALGAVAACGGYQKLKVDDVKSVAVSIDEPEQRFCAYAPVELRARVTYKNGDTAQTQTPGEGRKGRLRPAEFEWVSAFGTIDDTAVLRLAPDPFAWLEQPIRVSAKVAARPEMFGATELAPRFDCGGTLDLKGAKGARGGELEDGGAGAPGPVVDVALAYLESPRRGRLVLVRVAREGAAAEYFAIDAMNAQKPFVIDASGGDGGRGGQGAAGLYGAAGLPGAPGTSGPGCDPPSPGGSGSPGTPGGPGGAGRNGGAGGPGGRVTVRFDARYPELADRIEVRVDGGAAGDAGSGGPGGFGGAGGAAGPGGKINPGCPGTDAAPGAAGTDGAAGPTGPAGQPGVAGPAGVVQRAPTDVTSLFADEIGRGIAVATGAPTGAPATGGAP